MGLKSLFINRIDAQEKSIRQHEKELEFLWRPYNAFSGKDSQIFGHVFWHHYSVPFYWDSDAEKDILVMNPPQNESAWDAFSKELHEYFLEQKSTHMTNHFLFLVGDDFAFS